MAKQTFFTPKLFQFFIELAQNNERAWFQANKERFETHVRTPALAFITAFGPHLAKISKRYVADARPVGGSLFRINRDIRFAKDKSPYKTMAGLHFRHEHGKDVHAPGFYLHLEPKDVFMGAGLWHPEPEQQQKIRAAIVAKPAAWKKVSAAALKDGARLSGESYKRPPKGVDPEHPLIADLMRKDFITLTAFTERQATSPDFLERFVEGCRAQAPLMKFLTGAVGLEW